MVQNHERIYDSGASDKFNVKDKGFLDLLE